MGFFSRLFSPEPSYDELDKAIIRAMVAISLFDRTMGTIARNSADGSAEQSIDTVFSALAAALADKGNIDGNAKIGRILGSKVERLASQSNFTVNDLFAFPLFTISAAISEAVERGAKQLVINDLTTAGDAFYKLAEDCKVAQTITTLCLNSSDKYTRICGIIDEA